MTSALVLAGHGSHLTPQTAGLVWAHVDALRKMGAADEITATFWKEAPSFHTALDSLLADDVTVIPMFTAQGYFTQNVIPAEMGLSGSNTVRDGRTIRYARTLSEHPHLFEIVRRRVRQAFEQLGVSPQETAVAIIGHSTRRNPESRKAAEVQAAQLRALGIALQVTTVYLDDEPEIAQIYTLTNAPNLIAVPYFLASGSHTTIDVPAALGLQSGQNTGTVNGRAVYYTSPVGTEENLIEVILELAREAGAVVRQDASSADWACFPAAGRRQFINAVMVKGAMRFGELRITSEDVRVWHDQCGDEIITTPGALRARVRENPFRSLATSAGLPGGWRVPVADEDMLCAVVETIYPGAIADWAAYRQGGLKVASLDETVKRQVGNYRRLGAMSPKQRTQTVQRVCGQCVRSPIWFNGDPPAQKIPCPEACNHWLSSALERMG